MEKLEYEATGIFCKINTSIIKWPKEKFVILATIDNSITVFSLESESALNTFQASGQIWDFLLINTKIVALTQKEEVFEGVSLENKEVIEGESEEKVMKNTEKEFFEKVYGIFPQEP